MVHNPLMLNDTAMVLLERYLEMDAHYNEIKQHLSGDSATSSDEMRAEWQQWMTTHDPLRQMFRLQTEFLQEVWVLWINPDLPYERQLDWHLVLQSELIQWAVETEIMTKQGCAGYTRGQILTLRSPFMNGIIRAYGEAQASRLTKTASDKDQS